MPLILKPLDVDDGLSHIIVDRPLLLLGRHAECDIQLDTTKISRRHCCLAELLDEQGKSIYAIRDLESTNGIRINGNLVQESRINAGDEVIIGAFRFLAIMEEIDEMPRDTETHLPTT